LRRAADRRPAAALAGFFSKDEILWFALASERARPWLLVAAAATALMTAFYMFRLLWLTFFGHGRAWTRRPRTTFTSPPWSMGWRARGPRRSVGDRRLLLDPHFLEGQLPLPA